MNKFPQEFSIIAKKLYDQKELKFYTLYEDYKLSPAQIVQFIQYINNQNSITLIVIEKDYISLTEEGRKFIIANKDLFYLHTGLKENITFAPETKNINFDGFYLPNKKNIAKLD